jgi:hypothetical protein
VKPDDSKRPRRHSAQCPGVYDLRRDRDLAMNQATFHSHRRHPKSIDEAGNSFTGFASKSLKIFCR